MNKKYQVFVSSTYKDLKEERGGIDFMKPDMKVKLKKEPDNEYDKEAIKVSMKGLGTVGYLLQIAPRPLLAIPTVPVACMI